MAKRELREPEPVEAWGRLNCLGSLSPNTYRTRQFARAVAFHGRDVVPIVIMLRTTAERLGIVSKKGAKP